MHRTRTHGTAGVVLAGGRSSRMGTSKPHLDWHGSSLLHRMTGLLSRAVVGPVIVVAAPGQDLPELPDNVLVAEDPIEGLGPLQGIAAGLNAAAEHQAHAFVCSTDMPFLHPAFIQRVLACMADADVALPVLHGYRQPLAAAYRTELGQRATDLIEKGAKTPGELFAESDVRELSAEDLLADEAVAAGDPDLASVRNLNTPEDYDAARAEELPEISVQVWGSGLNQGKYRSGTVRVATLGGAAAAMNFELTRYVMATLNAERVTDPMHPLVRGDALAILGG